MRNDLAMLDFHFISFAKIILIDVFSQIIIDFFVEISKKAKGKP